MSDSWSKIETREQLDKIIEDTKNETVNLIFTTCLRAVVEIKIADADVLRVASTAFANAWRQLEPRIDAHAAEIRKQIPPSLQQVAINDPVH